MATANSRLSRLVGPATWAPDWEEYCDCSFTGCMTAEDGGTLTVTRRMEREHGGSNRELVVCTPRADLPAFLGGLSKVYTLTIVGIEIDAGDFPDLPETTGYVKFHHCNLREFPRVSNTVRYLETCWNPRLTSLGALPNNLVHLDVTFCALTSLPNILPESLKELIIDNNSIRVINKLPSRLEKLKCCFNLIEELPEIPESLVHINAWANRLKVFPRPYKQLEWVYIDRNQITEVPEPWKMPASGAYPVVGIDIRILGTSFAINHSANESERLSNHLRLRSHFLVVLGLVRHLRRLGLPAELTRMILVEFLSSEEISRLTPGVWSQRIRI